MAPFEVEQLKQRLKLEPHPEGGFFAETFRDVAGPDGRAHSTAIFYLLDKGARSKLHRLDAAEMWHFYQGGPLTVVEVTESEVKTTTLGHDLAAGQVLQHVVPPNTWFGAVTQERTDFSLVGCTVAPGFLFENFEMAAKEKMLQQYPHAQEWIERLLG